MVCSSLPMNRPTWTGGILVPIVHMVNVAYMHVHDFEGAMFEDEIEYGPHYMRRWTVFG